MNLVATLIAGTDAKLLPELVQKLAAQSEKTGVKSSRVAWLAPDKAADIFGEGLTADHWRAALLQSIGDAPVDVIVQPAADRQKKFLAADMESTIIEQELLDELAGEIGVREKVAAITRRSMNGEVDFVSSLRERMALFAGQPVTLLEQAARRITYMPGAGALLAAMKANGATCWLITGGFSFFAAMVTKKLGFDRAYANELIVKDGVITGAAAEPILDRDRKKTLLEQGCKEQGVNIADSLAVGDGANDVPMLTRCNEGGGLGVAFHAKPAVRAVVSHQINHADLTGLLYAQGLSVRG